MKKITTLDKLKQDVQSLIDYNWDAEMKDYEHHIRENGDTGGHIFDVLKRLQAWIE